MKTFYQLSNQSFKKFKVKNYKELWDVLLKKGYKGIAVDCFTKIKQKKDGDNLFTFIFSTAKEDRHGDVVQQNFDLKPFKKNPVLLDSHNYDSIEHIIGKVKKIKVKDNKLQGDVEFALSNPKGELAKNLVEDGFLNATSIGFIPKVFDDSFNILESELLEISMVGVPANSQSLRAKKYGKSIKTKKNNRKAATRKRKSDSNRWKKAKECKVVKIFTADEIGEEAKTALKKEFENWDNGDLEIRLKVRDIAEFAPGTLKRVTFQPDLPKIFAIVGDLVGGSSDPHVQSFFFPKEEGWTIDDAKKWFTVLQHQILGEQSNNSDSLNIGKSVNKKILESINICQSQKTKAIKKIASAIDAVSSHKVVESHDGSKAATNREINRAVRSLIKIKERE